MIKTIFIFQLQPIVVEITLFRLKVEESNQIFFINSFKNLLTGLQVLQTCYPLTRGLKSCEQ